MSCEEDVVDETCFNEELAAQYDSTNCPFVNAPVCGCNNVTYLNACLAYQDGFDVQDTLPCVEQ